MVNVTRARSAQRGRQQHCKQRPEAASSSRSAIRRPSGSSRPPLENRSRSRNRNRICAVCNKRTVSCTCVNAPPALGHLVEQQVAKFTSFTVRDTRRRFLGDCLDVILFAQWWENFLLEDGLFKLGLLAMFMFRHFNRISTWACILPAFNAEQRQPDWDTLESELMSSPKGLHKPFAIPVTYRDEEGNRVGKAKIENAVAFFKALWEHASHGKFS